MLRSRVGAQHRAISRDSGGTGRRWGGASVEPIVNARAGRVRGQALGGVWGFKGIPYGAPPFGANRFGHPGRLRRGMGCATHWPTG